MVTDPAARANRFITALTMAGAAALAVAMFTVADAAGHVDRIAALAALALAAVFVPLRLTQRDNTAGFTLEVGVLVAVLFVLPAGYGPVLLALATAIGHVLRRSELRKVAFNVAASVLASSAAAIAFAAVGRADDALAPRSLLAGLVAVVAFDAVNMLALSELFRRLQDRAIVDTARELLRLFAVTSPGNLVFGLLLAFVTERDVRATILASALMLGLYLGYRGYAGVLEDRRRADELRDLTRALVDVTTTEDSLETFLRSVSNVFGASSAALLVVGEERRSLVAGADEALPGELEDCLRSGRAARADAGGARLVAPLLDGGRIVGALGVSGRSGLEPWSDSDLHLLETLANEAVVSVRNIELFRDVTHERARLEEETSKLADIIGAASDGIMLIDREGRVAEWNTAMVDMTGLERDDVIGRPWYLSLRVRDSQGEDLPVDGGTPLHRAIAGQAIDQLDLQIMRRDGAWRAVRASIASIERSDEHAGAVLVIRDVTYEREVQELRSDFIATVSHELRTPLTPLNGFLELLVARGTAMSVEQTEEIHRAMRTQVSRLSALVDDMLMMADLDKDQVELQSRAVDLRKVAERAVELEAKRADDADRITVVTAGDAVAMADPSAAVRVTRALISNALKHTDGPVRVTIDGHDERAMISVADQGSGIPTRDLDRIFERFGRLGDHLHRTQGPGLGLTIARTLAHELGGDVEVVSRIGHGSTFTFRLARARPRLVQDAKERRTG